MTNFELIQELVKRVEGVENDLRYLKEFSEPATVDAIDKSLILIGELYNKFKNIDQALEDERMGYVLL